MPEARTTGTATSRARDVRPAQRRPTKARLAISGPSGAGKTWTALSIAEVLAPGGRVLVIDTEQGDDLQGASELYADAFRFDVIKWAPPYDPRDLAMTLEDISLQGEDSRPAAVIVDSASHFWRGEGGSLDIANGKFGGWRTATPAGELLIKAILGARYHVIVCTRAKQDYSVEEGADGKQKVTKLGLAPIQRDDLEYEFQVVVMMDMDHRMDVGKTRAHPLAGQSFAANTQGRFAAIYKAWLDSGVQVVREDEAATLRDALRKCEAGAQWAAENWPKVQYLDANLLEDAWAWLETKVDMPAHPFIATRNDPERCDVCECLVRARWHREASEPANSVPTPANGLPLAEGTDGAQPLPEALTGAPSQSEEP